MTRSRSKAGFTMSEVVVVLAIVATMLGAIIPNLMTAIQNYRLSASARDVASQIQNARYRSLKNNAVCSFMLLPTGGQFGVDSNGDGTISTGTTDVILPLNSNISFADLNTPPASLTNVTTLSTGSVSGIGFTPRGTLANINTTTGLPDFTTALPANGFVMYLSNTRNKYMAITVSPAGRVRTWSSSNGSTWR
jgi:prepilin-type N-terminal cleavage/methylation domain-containing protein